jgi:hypothetical protein
LKADVPPGGDTEGTLIMDLPVDPTPGEYVVKIDLVDEFVCWFSDVPGNQPCEHRIVVTP